MLEEVYTTNKNNDDIFYIDKMSNVWNTNGNNDIK